MINVEYDASQTIVGMYRAEGLVDLAARKAFRASVDAGVQHAKGTTLWKDGSGGKRFFTRSTIQPNYGDGLHGEVIAKGAAHFLEWGTTAHTITAKQAPFLAFEMGGMVFFKKSVKHPGTKARPFMQEAQMHMSQTLEYGLDFYVEEALKPNA